jgi:glycosyltransferase involved in cell wall biosynthesis
MVFPKVLIVAMGRINAADMANNGLLLRNLFGAWPREKMAQIYSGGDNGDAGFFGNYYQLGPDDRRLGKYFFKLKAGEARSTSSTVEEKQNLAITPCLISRLKTIGRQVVMDTGLYELIFRPQLSKQMIDWVREFKPDFIFAQGYNLAFTWLPLMLKRETGARMALLATDDWPTYIYSGQLGESKLFSWLLRPAVVEATRQLMADTDVPFAFGHAMAEEYRVRYGKSFIVLSHADDRKRFDDTAPLRIHEAPVRTIVAVGNFNAYRWPLMLDVNGSCRLLADQGLQVRLAVISCGIDPEGERALANCSHIDLLPDPGNDLLPAYLKGADLLLLAEGFDKGFVDAIRLSVSSKSHLFMFSRRPIIVYAHPETGVAKYAAAHGWGLAVTERNVTGLAAAIRTILTDAETADRLVLAADETAMTYHVREACQAKVLSALSGEC